MSEEDTIQYSSMEEEDGRGENERNNHETRQELQKPEERREKP